MGRRPASLFEIRPSPVHGLGAFAVRAIREGTRIAEYVGERLNTAEVDARYGGEEKHTHTFLFRVDDDTYVDASRGGNESRFINHSCDPNCESDVIDGRIYISAIRDIPPGAELTYDYALEADEDPEDGAYACRCGSAQCRGTMLEARSEPAADA
jgi:SET domain-containing protein